MTHRRYIAFHWAVILATPFLLLAVDRNVFIITNANGWIDPWLYTGFLLDLPHYLIRWGDTYYATRLAWLLPGYAVHELFTPITANYILHIAFFYVLLFTAYALVTAGINRTTGFVFTLLIAWNPEIISAMGWDYVDGAVITYFVISLLCFEKASSGTRRWLWAAAGGAGLACLAASNLVAATLWPVCGLFLLLRVGLPRWRTTVAILAVAVVGSVAMLAIFGVVNEQLGGRTFFFLKPSLNYATTNLWLPSQFDAKGYGWIPQAPALILPAVSALGAALALVGRWHIVKSFSGAVQVTAFVAVVWFVVHSMLWSHSIHVSYYTSYMIPLALLALAVHPDSPLHFAVVSARRAIALELGILSVLVIHLLIFRQGDAVWGFVPLTPTWFATASGINAYAAFAIAALAMVTARLARTVSLRWPAFLLALVMGYSSVPVNFPAPNSTRAREDFALTATVHDFIYQHLDFNRKIRMWYSLRPGEPRPYRGISSTFLWGYVLLNEAMPSLEPSTLINQLVPEERLVLMAATEQEIDDARQALLKAKFDHVPVVRGEFGAPGETFHVVIGDLKYVGSSP